MVASVTAILLIMAASAYAHTETAGELDSPGEADCSAVAANNATIYSEGESIRFNAGWEYSENSGGKEDKWTFTLDAHWTQSPGAPPNDDGDSDVEADVPEVDQEGITGTLATGYWDSGDFAEDGTYKLEVTVEVLHQVRPNHGVGDWSTSCNQSDSVIYTIEYTDGDGGVIIIWVT